MALVACVAQRRGRVLVGEPFFEPGLPVTLGSFGRVDAAPGQLVLIESVTPSRGRLVRVLGDTTDVDAVLAGLAEEAGVAQPFPSAAQRHADAAGGDPAAPDRRRRDLTHHAAFTLDPVTAKDHDDAISVERDGAAYTVFIHIADVAAVVRPGEALDSEAKRRGFSSYLPGRVDPMLPLSLSTGRLSLAAHRPRDVVTVQITISDGGVHPASFYRARIRSRRRFSYDDAEAVLEGAAARADAAPDAALREADGVARRLRAERERRGALMLAQGEVVIMLRAGRVADARLVGEPRAHALVEELMLAANRAVAGELVRHRQPAVFRVHEPPDPDSVRRLYEQLAGLDVPTPPLPDVLGPSHAAAAISAAAARAARFAAERRRNGEAYLLLCLRAVMRARYASQNLGHSGLAASAYCHFTSPIRRYADLVCHRALLASVGLEPPPAGEGLDELSRGLSDRERELQSLERRGTAICLAFLAADRHRAQPGVVFDGEVTGLIGAGAFVRFGGVLDGFVPARRLGLGRVELAAFGTVLAGPQGRIRLADAVRVVIERVEPARGRVTLGIVR